MTLRIRRLAGERRVARLHGPNDTAVSAPARALAIDMTGESVVVSGAFHHLIGYTITSVWPALPEKACRRSRSCFRIT